MATYKVLQDIEAEDKLLGPLTLKQFIFAAIAAVSVYLCFFALTKHASFLIIFFFPIGLIAGFLAWPWSRDQPTEIWLLAKIRFFLKPRRRIWNQDGIQELVTVTVPKKLEVHLTNDMSQTEVKSRLKALADTIDSRGWAIKNVNFNAAPIPAYASATATSDRLIDLDELPQEVPTDDIVAADDMMDAQHNPVAHQLDEMIGASTQQHRKQLLKDVQAARNPVQTPGPTTQSNPQDLWFMQPGVGQTTPAYSGFNNQAAVPGASNAMALPPVVSSNDEQALLAQLHADDGKPNAAYGHMKVIDPKGSKSKKGKNAVAATGVDNQQTTPTAPATNPAIIELASNDDLNVATIARQAKKARGEEPPEEVVIPLR